MPPKMPFVHSPVLPFFGSILSGLLLTFGFPPFGQATMVYAALVPLMFAVHAVSVRRAALLGLLSGAVFFLTSLGWLLNLTDKVEGIGLMISVWLGYLVLALYCALYVVPFAVTVVLGTRAWAGADIRRNLRFMFAVTMVWTGSEYLRGILFTGFPWNAIGATQYANPALIQIAEFGGVELVGACIVWMNAALFITFRQYTHGTRVRKYRPHYELMIGLLPVALSVTFGMNVLFGRSEPVETVRTALVQPNIRQAAKWDDAQEDAIRETLERLTQAAARFEDVDLIIWPETALPDFLRSSEASRQLISRLTQDGPPLLVGTMDYSLEGERPVYFNSAVLIGEDGDVLSKYDKQHLVPFGEYVPFPGLMRKFTPIEVDFGAGGESTLLELPGHAPFSALICFEDTVAPLSVNAVRAGARWLVNQSNDAWFDPSAQSEQQLAHAVFRCVENRVPMARCCNTGVTAIIDAYGLVERNLNVRTAGFTIGELHPRPLHAERTFYTRYGSAFAKFSLAAGALVLFVFRTRTWRRPETET